MSQKNRYWLHILLFIVTFVTTTFAGMLFVSPDPPPYTIGQLGQALPFSLSILFILTLHEFGHYFAAKYHGVDATLPYYIPFPPFIVFTFGTMGAVIKTRSPIPNNRAMFDIGVAGPIAGFIASAAILAYGFANLPGREFIIALHPDYFDQVKTASETAVALEFGDSLMFSLFRSIFTNPNDFIPPMSEVYHYPYLCAGWFGLLITALNMVPAGQLDGGHIVYSMFGGKIQEHFAYVSILILFGLSILGAVDLILPEPMKIGSIGWLLWVGIIYFFIKPKHPELNDFEKLGTGRMALGYFSLIILILSFMPTPIWGG